MSSLLAVTLTISSFVAYYVCYNLVVERFQSRIMIHTPLQMFENNRNTFYSNPEMMRQEAVARVSEQLHNTLLSYFIISSILVVCLGALLAYFVIKNPLDKMSKGFQKLNTFVSDASHELRTPLSITKGYIELYRLKGSESLVDANETIDKIDQSTKRMTSLVEDLLTLTRVEQGKKVCATKVDILPILHEIAEHFEVLDNERKVSIITQLDRAEVQINEQHIWRVFVNLAQNIHRYTPKGSPVELKVMRVGDKVRIDFVDHGKGVESQDLVHIFDRFWTKAESRNREESGTGLGLAICKTIIESYSGLITASSTLGSGLTVSVFLPRV
jgi:two-component system OmpR family sensor kinase